MLGWWCYRNNLISLNMTKNQEQVIALAGLFQATYAVHELAKDGTSNSQDLETAVKSLFITSPKETLDVYGALPNLKNGFEALVDILDNKHAKRQVEPVRYAMALMHLERQLSKHPDMLSTIGSRLSHAENQVSHFGIEHENVYEGLAGIYTDTISTFKLRIQVAGRQEHLQVALNAAKIRTLLFAGIRAAMLWRQVGGHRWHFLFKRQGLLKACHELKSHANN